MGLTKSRTSNKKLWAFQCTLHRVGDVNGQLRPASKIQE